MDTLLVFLLVLVGLLAAFGLFWFGFVLLPKPFPPHPEVGQVEDWRAISSSLPVPLIRHFQQTLGDTAPQVRTAVAWGRGRIWLNGVWLPMRFKNWYRAGKDFFSFTEVTWYRKRVVTGRAYYRKGEGVVEMVGRTQSGRNVNQGLNLALWAEAVWFPSALALLPGEEDAYSQIVASGEDLRDEAPDRQQNQVVPHWQAIDSYSSRLVVPLRTSQGIEQDELAAYFDQNTGRMTHLSGMRFRIGNATEKEPWRVDLLEWKKIGETLLPVQVSINWGESGSPSAYWTLEGIAYNVDVSEELGQDDD